jgi:hypothetical protein
MSDPIEEPQVDTAPATDPQDNFSDGGVSSMALSDNLDLSKLPTVPTDPQTHAQDRSGLESSAQPKESTAPTYETSQVAPSETPASTTTPEAKPTSPLFATQQDKAPEAEKSKEAEEIRNHPTPKEFKGKTADLFNNLKSKWSGVVEAAHSQLRNAQKEHQEKLASLLKENEELGKRVSHLSGYESAIDYQSSEKFVKSYDEPVKSAEAGLIEFAKGWASPEGLKELQDNIGDRRYLINALSQIEKGRPDLATEFRLEMQKVLDSRRSRDNAINEAKTNHTKFVEERKAESVKKSAQFEEGITKTVQHYTTLVAADKQTPQFPFLVKQRAPAGASPDIIKQVDAHNSFVDSNLAALNQVVKSMDSDPSERVRMAVGYMTAAVQSQQIKWLSDQLKQKEDLLSRVNKAGQPPSKASGAVMPARPERFNGSLSEAVDAFMPRR